MGHILIADDDEASRKTLDIALSHLGHTVITASTVAKTVTFLKTGDYSLLICDLGPSGAGSLELLEWIKEHPRKPGFVTIVFDSNPIDTHASEFGSRHVAKPAVKTLIALVHELINHRS